MRHICGRPELPIGPARCTGAPPAAPLFVHGPRPVTSCTTTVRASTGGVERGKKEGEGLQPGLRIGERLHRRRLCFRACHRLGNAFQPRFPGGQIRFASLKLFREDGEPAQSCCCILLPRGRGRYAACVGTRHRASDEMRGRRKPAACGARCVARLGRWRGPVGEGPGESEGGGTR